MKTKIPLYRLEAARDRVESLFDPPPNYDDFEGDLWDTSDYRMDPEYQTLMDLLDEVIEEKRRENDAHRVKVARGAA